MSKIYLMKKIIVSAVLAATIIACNGSGGASGASSISKLENDDQKAAYAYGMNIGQQVQQFSESLKKDSLNYNELEKGIWDFIKNSSKDRESYAHGQSIGLSIQKFIESQKLEGKVDEKYVVAGVMDILRKNELKFSKDSVSLFMNDYLLNNRDRLGNENAEKGKQFLDKKLTESNVKSTPSGLLYEVIIEGTGEKPTVDNIVKVNYKGQLINGDVFDESPKGEPVEFPLGMVIQGWQEGLQLMPVGSKYKFYIPHDLAYGENGTPNGSIGPNETLIFEVELLEIQDAQEQQQGTQLSQEQLEELMRQAQQGN